MTTTFPTPVGPSPLGPAGGSPFGPASVEFGFEIPQGSPGELEALASGMRNASGWFGDQLTRVRASGQVALEASGGWQGSAAGSFAELTSSLAGTLSANELACEHAAGALGRLEQTLSHAQQVTGQAMSDCQRLHGDLVRQQQAAIDAGSRASSLEQDASNPMMHPSAISELQHQASLARGEQGAAQLAAAVIANPFASMPIAPFAPGSILDAIEEERYRNWALRSADTLASGGAAYSSQQAYWPRRQLTDNSRPDH